MNSTQNHSQKWLITGGCGFIGSTLIKHLIETEVASEIRVLDNLSVGTFEALSKSISAAQLNVSTPSNCVISFLEGDILNYDSCLRATEGMNKVVHLAANTGVGPSVENPRADMNANVVGTFNMLQASRINNISGFIFASSGAPLGQVIPPIHENLAPRPVSPYGASKLAGEGYCSAFYQSFALPTTALRFGNVYGKGSAHKESVIAKFVKRAFENKPLEIYGDGSQTRDFIYLDDLVNAILLSASSKGQGEVIQIATGTQTTISRIVDVISTQMKELYSISVPVINKPIRVGDVKDSYADISKAKQVIGWTPSTTLEAGIKETIQFFNEAFNGNIYSTPNRHANRPSGDSVRINLL